MNSEVNILILYSFSTIILLWLSLYFDDAFLYSWFLTIFKLLNSLFILLTLYSYFEKKTLKKGLLYRA